MASPPLLVVLGLTLPDSRILSGVASVGLTLANIAAILPHLRQPMLDGTYSLVNALAIERSTKETMLCINESSTTQPPDLPVESPVSASSFPRDEEHFNTTQPVDHLAVLVPRSPREREHQRQPLACGATTRSVCSADKEKEPLRCLNAESEVTPQTMLPPPVGKTCDDDGFPQISSSLDADSSRWHVSASHPLFAREGRCPLYISLPVPDAEEIVFFETGDDVLYESDLGGHCVAAPEEHVVSEEYSVIEDDRSTAGEDTIGQEGQFLVVHLPSAHSRVVLDGDLVDMAVPVANDTIWSPPTDGAVGDNRNHLVEGSVSDLPYGVTGSALQNAQFDKRRPESLEFVPQSVIRRYPAAPMVFTGRCFGHRRTFDPRQDRQFSSAPPATLVFLHNPEMLDTRPPINYTTLRGHCGLSFPPSTRWSTEGNALSTGDSDVSAHETANQSLPEPHTLHKPAPLRKHPTHRRRLGVLARAALRDRRSVARKRMDGENDDSSASESDSDSDSDSEYSSGSSTYEGMLPHILGTDLIAAIDADRESELNFCGPKKTSCSPLNLYEDFLTSEDSMADPSVIMQVSSNGEASNGEVRVPATSRSLTYEDIQQWATGVVQKCARQVCPDRVAAEPSSPSQASDVCAERPSGLGASRCPLYGLHCKLGIPASTEVPAPGTKQAPAPLMPTSTRSDRKPLRLRSLRDIPEFVPRQRHVSTITERAEDPRKLTRSGINATREAATQVIARMERQAEPNVRRPVGTEGKRTMTPLGVGRMR